MNIVAHDDEDKAVKELSSVVKIGQAAALAYAEDGSVGSVGCWQSSRCRILTKDLKDYVRVAGLDIHP